MPEPITYAQAAELAQRLDRERERGAVLQVDGRWGIDRFDFIEDAAWIDVRFYGHVETFFGVRFRKMTPAEFEAHWQARITVLRPTGWPTGEAVTWEQVRDEINSLLLTVRWGELTNAYEWRKAANNAERLADVCRRLATESGE